MKNINLYNAIRAYCQEAVKLLSLRFTNEVMPTRVVEEVEIISNHEISQRYSTEVQWDTLIHKKESELSATDSYAEAIKQFNADATIAKQLGVLVGTSLMSQSIQASECLRILLTNMLSKANALSFYEKALQEAYKEMEDYFYNDTFRFRLLAPIDGLIMDLDELDLGNNLKIIRLTNEERSRLLSNHGLFLSGLNMNIAFRLFAFEVKVESQKTIGAQPEHNLSQNPFEIGRNSFYNALSALRLFKDGGIGFNEIFTESEGWKVSGSLAISGGNSFRIGVKYKLTNKESQDFLLFWQNYQSIQALDRLEIGSAIKRFNFGLERLNQEDQLVDFTISLEALLLSEEQELSYKIAMRYSRFLGNQPDEREQISDVMKNAYKQRSKIVHGGRLMTSFQVGNQTKSAGELVELVKNNTRFAIRKYMDLAATKTKDEIIKDLDNFLVRG